MAEQGRVTEGVRRSIHALIQTLGANSVQLQLPAPPIANDAGEQLGLRTPEFQWKPLAPVALRSSNEETEMLVPADTLEQVLGVQGTGAVKAALETVSAVLIHGQGFRPTDVEAALSRGRECMYRIHLRLSAAEVR